MSLEKLCSYFEDNPDEFKIALKNKTIILENNMIYIDKSYIDIYKELIEKAIEK